MGRREKGFASGFTVAGRSTVQRFGTGNSPQSGGRTLLVMPGKQP